MGTQQTIANRSENVYFSRLPSIVSEFVRFCPDCQERKMTKAYTKTEIISYRTPTEPFHVWQMDLFRPLPITQKGNIYVFTTIDMFSKLLFTVPLPNCDSITVSHALFQLVFLVFVTVLLVTRAANVYLIVLENYVNYYTFFKISPLVLSTIALGYVNEPTKQSRNV